MVAAIAGSVLVLGFFLFVDLGGTVTGTVHPFSLVAAAIWAGPFWLYARLVRTRSGALLGGAVVLGATAAFLVPLFRNTHSTAGIGIITIPMLMYPIAAAVLAVDRLFAARHEGEPVLSGFARRLVAVALSFVVVIAAVSMVVGIVSLFDPVTRGDLVGSFIVTAVSAAAATGGTIAIKQLWRTPTPGARARRGR